MPYCINCGAEVKGDERFCSTCGHPLESKSADVSRPVRKRRKSSKVLWVVAVLAIVGLVASILVLGVPWKDVELSEELTIADETQPSELVLGDGTTVVIPPGSLPAGAIVTIRQVDAAAVPKLPRWASAAVSPFDISLDRPLRDEATIQVPLPDSELSVLGHYHDGYWEAMPFLVKNGKAVVEVEELSLFSWLDIDVTWLADEITNFLTLRWVEEKPVAPSDEAFNVDDSEALGLVSGSAHYTADNKVRLVVYNMAPIHLDVFPVEGNVEIKRTGLFISAEHEQGTIIAPQSAAEWVTELASGESVTFEAYFSDFAVVALSYDLIPSGRLMRGVMESSLFARHGREMGWGDIKGLLVIPTLAEAAKTIEELEPVHTLNRGRIRFSRAEPLLTPGEVVEKLYRLASERKYAEAERLISPKLIEAWQSEYGSIEAFWREGENEIAGREVLSVEIIKEKISNRQASVDVVVYFSDGTQETYPNHFLEKINDRWLLSIKEELPASEPAPSARPNAWRVDDDLQDYPKADFTKIGQALNAASAGNTIIVYPGKYTENLDVSKGQLTIKSESGADTAIIQALNSNDHVLEIKAADVKISGFTIRGATGNDKAGIYIYDSPLLVSDLILSNNNYGIYVYSTPRSPLRVSGSTFSSNNRGIYSQSSYASRYGEVHVSDSTFSDNKYGIYTSDFCGVDVSKSAFSNNDYGIYGNDRMSVHAEYSSFSQNTYGIYGNSIWGINSLHSNFYDNDYGVYAINGWDNTLSISYSDFRNNRQGIYYKASTLSSHTVFLNNFIDNTGDVDSSPSKYIWNSAKQMTYTHNGKTYTSYLGNYWSGYSGSDTNGDGIGDIPYKINSERDNYPLMKPWGN